MEGLLYEDPMSRAAAVLLLLAALGANPASAAQPDPMKLYGGAMVFAVWRSGSKIGQHTVNFSRENGALVVRSLFDIVVKLLGIPVYRYKYQSQETWRAGKLARLSSVIDDDGTQSSVEAVAQDDKLAVTGPEFHGLVPLPILPSTHWNAEVISADRVLNTISGKIDAIKLVPQGIESVPTNAGPRQATHYLYTGDIQAESWYDSDGHWLKLRFPGKDGTPIDYVCARCVAPPAGSP
jgi:hypothetical protein